MHRDVGTTVVRVFYRDLVVVLRRPCYDVPVRLEIRILLPHYLRDWFLCSVVYRYYNCVDVIRHYDRPDDGAEPFGHSGTEEGHEEFGQGVLGTVPAWLPGREDISHVSM